MKKIVAINCTDKGSTGNIAITLLSAAINRGWSGYLLCPYPTTSEVPTFNTSCGRLIRLINKITTKVSGLDGFKNHLDTYRIIRFLKKYKPDIVHLHVLHGYYININKLFKFLNKTKTEIVWTFHDSWAYTGKCCYYKYNKCDKWIKGCCDCNFLKEYPKSYFLDATHRCYKYKKHISQTANHLTIVSVSEWLNNEVSKSFFSSCRHVRIYNGFSFKSQIPSKSNCEKESNKKIKVFCAAKPWGKRKGIEVINELQKINYLKGEPLSLVCAGLTETIYTTPGIIRIPALSREEMAQKYRESDVFLNSSHEETFGLTVLESLFFGTPVVVMKGSGGCEEIVTEKCGRIVDSNDLKKIFDNLIYLGQKKYDFSNSCRLRANEFAENLMVNEYLSLYEQLREN